MKKAGKIILIVCGSFILFVASLAVFWQLYHAYYEPKKKEAMRFCEGLIPMIEAARERDGKYPARIEHQWIEGKRIPKLVRTEDFYVSYGDQYLLRFRNPGDFYDDIWGYHGSPGTGRWVNYDGY